MTTGTSNKPIAILVGLLIVAVVVQSVVMVNLYQRSAKPEARSSDDHFRIDLQSNTGSGSSPSGSFGSTPGIWDPFQEFRSMRQQMDQMFNDSFARFRQAPDFQSMWGATIFSPSMDLEEKKDCYVVRMDVPGTDKSNLSVIIDDRELKVSGTVEEAVEEQGRSHLRKERRTGEFNRTIILPGPVKPDEMKAQYEDGVLTITVPKAVVMDDARNIEIK